LKKEIEEEALREAYLGQGLSIEGCAKLFDCSTNKIWRLLRKYGIQTRSKDSFTKYAKIPEDALRRAYLEEKRTLKECGELFGASAKVVGKALKFYGIPVRVGGPIKGKNYPERKKKELFGLEELWEEGYGVRDIAFLLGADETLVRKRLKSLGKWLPNRKPTRKINWGERCTRCGILFDCELFSKTEKGICFFCEMEMMKGEEKKARSGKRRAESENTQSGEEETFSPLELLAKWKGFLSSLPREEAEKKRKELLDAIRAKLSLAERRFLKRIQKQLKIRGLGKVSTLELVAQLGILFEEFDYR
jgi:hypothetical protein